MTAPPSNSPAEPDPPASARLDLILTVGLPLSARARAVQHRREVAVCGGVSAVDRDVLSVHAASPNLLWEPLLRPRHGSFRRVGAPLSQPVHEHLLACTLRAHHVGFVHVLGLGDGCSVHLPWVARSLGVRCTLEVDAAGLLCHRGDLHDWRGEYCTDSRDPARCATCCRVHTPGRASLPRWQALLAAGPRWLGDVSPFPTPLSFRNRRDLIAAALTEPEVVFARDVAARDAARALGVEDSRLVCLASHDDVAPLLQVWGMVKAL